MPKQNLIYLDSFSSGLFTNRSALTMPRDGGVEHTDVLIDGLNTEITPKRTIGRRPGFPTYCSGTAFGASEWPLNFWSGRLNSTLYDLVDTQTAVYTFDPTTITSIYTKTTTAQSYFQQVGNLLFFSDGTLNKKWDGLGVTNNGIVAPTLAPAIANLNFLDLVAFVQTVHSWTPNYIYTGPATGVNTLFLKDPNGNVQFAFVSPQQTCISGSASPTWSTTTGANTIDGSVVWVCAGPVGTWTAAMTGFVTPYSVTGIQTLSAGPNLPTAYSQSGSTAVWSGTLPGALTASASSTQATKMLALDHFGFALPTGAVPVGIVLNLTRHGNGGSGATAGKVADNTIQLLKAGVATGSNKAVAGAWGAGTVTQTYGSSTDMWGATLIDTDINALTFGVQAKADLTYTGATKIATVISAKLTVHYTIGSITGAYTSTIILDSNGNLQRIKTNGTAGGSAPTWAKVIGSTTTDNTITWECMGTGNVLAANVGWRWAYGFHTLSSHLSTMSPQLSLVAPIIGNGVTLTGLGSDDTQCDRNDLYRNTDGGSLLLYDASANNVDGSTSWSIFDNVQDVALNTLLVGPIAHVNDPPPTGLTLLTYYIGRLWGAVGNLLYFSAGPDCTNGDGFQSWPPANVFTLPSNITGIVASSQGLVVFTSDQMWMVLGGPQTLTFYLQPILSTLGILSPNCLVQDGDTLFVYTSSRQLLQLTMNGKAEIGFPVADLHQANFDPSVSSLALHRSGKDEGLFLSNGSTTVMRFSLRFEAWSPTATITGGVGLIKSLETTAGVYTLVAGRAAGSLRILGRSLTSFLDGASAYSGYATLGSLVLSPPGTGTLVAIKRVVLEYLGSLSTLTCSVLPNEISGSFTSIPFSAADPFQLPATTTVVMSSFDWLGVATPVPSAVKHLQVKVTFPPANAADELVGLGIIPHV